ncbi:hypothetical protein RAZWK3B_02330 [Roseobacter sp. AzwK-3b]|nr:hypothetical protein RAZWK3B_02330 [Roseobacter sp. AzwK-3b]
MMVIGPQGVRAEVRALPDKAKEIPL